MISKNIFSAVLVSIFVLSVFSFLSGNALGEITYIQHKPEYPEIGEPIEFYFVNNLEDSVKMAQFLVYDIEGISVYGSGPINITVNPGETKLVFTWNQEGDTSNYDGPVPAGNYTAKIKFSVGGASTYLDKQFLIQEKAICTDSDGGKDYYENGKITYDNGNSETYDLCVNDKTLKEGYCVNGKYNYEYYNCPYGCIVGKCLKSYETGKKYHLDLEKKKIFEITFNGVDYTIDTTQLSCFYSTAHKLIISYDDKTFISDRIGPYEKFNLENGDYLINSGCPTGAPVINLAFIGKKRTTTTTTIPSETGYDVCNNGKGWSEPSSSAQKCGWPSGSKGNMKDCCCCYLTTHVHDLGKIFNEGSSIEIEYKPGWAQGCTSPMFVYYSEDGKEWNLFYNATVTQETWHPKTIYKKTLTVPGDFRYIKIYIPKCYNDYSSAKVIATGGGGGEGRICPTITMCMYNSEEDSYKVFSGCDYLDAKDEGWVDTDIPIDECGKENEQPSQSTEVSVQIPETTATTVVQEDVEKTCSGCWYKYKCVQYGVRITENGVPSYCDFDGAFKVQKENGEDCLNNYECKSNFCSDGECYNIKGELKETKGLLESIMSFLRSLFGFGKK